MNINSNLSKLPSSLFSVLNFKSSGIIYNMNEPSSISTPKSSSKGIFNSVMNKYL